MQFTIRPGTREDLPAMRRLWREMMDFHASVEPRFRPQAAPAGEEAWQQHMERDVWDGTDWHVLVAESDGQVIGQIIGLLRDPYPVFQPERYGYVSDVVVDPRARRSGVGRALFEALKAWFRGQGVRHLQLQVAHRNSASQAFWRAVGCTDYLDTLWYDLEEE